jgi:SAM-dependent methyltransferase
MSGRIKIVVQTNWARSAHEYAGLVQDAERDSHYLRGYGLKPTILRMAGDCSDASVLDAGCGDGWLLDALLPREGHGSDIYRYEQFPTRWDFRRDDIRSLSYPEACFDVAVASLVLMWFPELDLALSELRRVTKPGGRVVIAIMNPYFYRTGEVDENGRFAVHRKLAAPFIIDNHHIADVVGPFVYHYWPLPDYLNACVRAGLTIEEVADWYLDMNDFIAHFGTDRPGNIRRTGDVPMYTFILCIKE